MKNLIVLCLTMLTLNYANASVHCADETEFNFLMLSQEQESQNIELMLIVEELANPAQLYFSGDINSASINRLIKKIDDELSRNTSPVKEIVITLNSIGGDINAAIKAVRYIKKLNKDPNVIISTKVSSFNDCESACTVLFTAGEKRFASPRSKFGFHSPKFESGDTNGRSSQEVEEQYRGIWINYIGYVDLEAAAYVKQKKFLYDEEMSYVYAKNLLTGYVTDQI